MAKDSKPPVTRKPEGKPAEASPAGEIDAFLKQARALGAPSEGRGRLIFALDATMSRQPTWDTACQLQAEMFEEAGKVGGLEVQLVYFRGFGECRASRWVSDTRALRDLMTGIDCPRRPDPDRQGADPCPARGGASARSAALVFVGDALEEPIDALAAKAGELGLLGLRMFIFQEGRDAAVERGFREIARLTGGAYARFDANAAGQLAAAPSRGRGLRRRRPQGAGEARRRGGRLLLEQMRSADGLSLRRRRRPRSSCSSSARAFVATDPRTLVRMHPLRRRRRPDGRFGGVLVARAALGAGLAADRRAASRRSTLGRIGPIDLGGGRPSSGLGVDGALAPSSTCISTTTAAR